MSYRQHISGQLIDSDLHGQSGADAAAPPFRRTFVLAAGFVAIYLLIAWSTRYYMVRPFAITPWNPSGGFALAFLLVFGVRYWPALAVASVSASLLLRGMPVAPYTQLLAPAILTIGYVAMAAFLRGPLRFRHAFDRPREIVKLAAVSTFGTVLMAIAYVSVFRSISAMTEHDYHNILLRFWIGHLIGIVINTPLLLLLTQRPWLRYAPSTQEKLEVFAQTACILLTLWVIFGPRWVDPYKFFYLLFLPVIWIATRHGIAGAVFGTAAIQLGLIVALVNSEFQSGIGITEFQFMMLALALAGLFLGMAVTENRSARESLARSDSRLRAIVSTAPDGIVTVDRNNRIVASNPATSQIFGHPEYTLAGLNVNQLLPAFDTISARGDSSNTDGVRSDGSHFPAEVSIGHTDSAAGELRIAVIRDITRRVETAKQLSKQQDELSRASRLAAAGEMAAALAHELHQPLTAIRSYARAAQMQAAESGRLLPAKIDAEAARAAAVVQRLRDFFRGGISQLENVPVNALIDGALAPMRDSAAQQGVAIETNINCSGVQLLVDRIQVETVIHTLVQNAFEAMATNTDRRRLIKVSAEPQPDGLIRLSVMDSGPGIAASMAGHLFEPFATTKATGTGMGLAMIRSMVEAHGGQIWIDSPPDGGTIFHFTLPSTALSEAII